MWIPPMLYVAMNTTGTMKNSSSHSSGAESSPAVTRRLPFPAEDTGQAALTSLHASA